MSMTPEEQAVLFAAILWAEQADKYGTFDGDVYDQLPGGVNLCEALHEAVQQLRRT